MRLNRKPLSIKKIFTIFFILTVLISITGIGTIIFQNWLSSSEQFTKSISSDHADPLINEIDPLARIVCVADAYRLAQSQNS